MGKNIQFVEPLTRHQGAVFVLARKGQSIRDIAQHLNITTAQVRQHLRTIRMKVQKKEPVLT